MGCGCGNTNRKPKVETRSTISRVKRTIKKAWDATQPTEQPTHVVKRIYKKN